jgi:hypothetical protein
MDAYKDETVLRQGSKSKSTASKGSKGKDKKPQKKKSSRPDTRDNVREHVDRLDAACVPSNRGSEAILMMLVLLQDSKLRCHAYSVGRRNGDLSGAVERR